MTAQTKISRHSRAAILLGMLMLLVLPAGPAAARHRAVRRPAGVTRTTAPSGPGQSSYLMDSDTGAVLEQINADVPLHPASLTKTMTLLLTFEALQQGRLHVRDAVPISSHAADMMPSKLGLKPGSSIAVEDAIYAVCVHSANDIAVALAEKVGGSEPGFVALMNRRAAQLGMKSTHFINASGLHNPQQFSSAHDMATLAHYIIQAHPDYYRYFNTRTFIYRGNVYQNHNHLMETYRGMDGLKTGFIQQSGFNLIASAKRDGHRLIGVIFGGRSTAARNAAMAALLDQGFAHENEMIAANHMANEPAPRPAAIMAPQSASALPVPAAPYASRLPVVDTTIASATPGQVSTAPGDGEDDSSGQTTNDVALPGGALSAMEGQGDSDPAAASRVETGLAAISDLRQHPANPPALASLPAALTPAGVPAVTPAMVRATPPARPPHGNRPQSLGTLAHAPPASGAWAVQIGAFDNKDKSSATLGTALNTLPLALKNAQAQIVPLRTTNGWLYRARLTGYNRDQAFAACKLLADCVPVSPQLN